MADYIYLLENRLSGAQQSALRTVREIARLKGLTLFLVGGAVRDLTSGSPVRDLDLAVQGNALKLKKDFEKAGAQVAGEYEPLQALYLRFPGNVRMEVSSTLAIHYPKPGKPVVKPASILEDLRRRDFTANAMALSLNEGSYGLLMDPLNGVADIENRELRLVSNYGFIEDPVRMIRVSRLGARLGWQMEERTLARYETGKTEGYVSAMGEFQRGYELEEIVHEDDPMRVLARLESEGWMKVLFAAWTPAKANVPELEKLREAQAQLQMQGIHGDPSAAQFPLLTAKLSPKDISALKQSFPRPAFVAEIDALEGEAKRFAAELGSKQAATSSGAWKMIFSAPPEVVLWVAYTTRSAVLQAKFRSFYTDWPSARQRIPYVMMQEMRIVPELPGYAELVDRIFFELMDGRLGTPEEMKAFLEPHSPPAPPPPINLRRARAAKTARPAKGKKRPEADAAADGGASVPPELAVAAGASEAADVVGSPAEAAVKAAAGFAAPVSKAAKANPSKGSVAVPTSPAETKVSAAAPAKKAAPVKAVVKAPAHTVKASAVPAKKVVAPASVAKKAAEPKAAEPRGPVKKALQAKNVSAKGTPVAARSARSGSPAKKGVKASPAKAPGKAGLKTAGTTVTKAGVKSPQKGSAKLATKAPAAGHRPKKKH